MATIFDVVIAGGLIVGGYFLLTSGALDNIGGNTVEGGGDVVGGDTTGETVTDTGTDTTVTDDTLKVTNDTSTPKPDKTGGTSCGEYKVYAKGGNCSAWKNSCGNYKVAWAKTCGGKQYVMYSNVLKASDNPNTACKNLSVAFNNKYKTQCGSTTGGNTATGSCPCKNKPSCGNVGGYQTCKLCCCKDTCQKLGYKTGPIGSLNSKGACICGTCSERCKKLNKGYTGGSIKNGSCICTKPSTLSCNCPNKPDCGKVGGFQTCKLCCCKDTCRRKGYKTGPIGSLNSKGQCLCGTCSERCKKLGKGYTGGSVKNGSCICSKSSSSSTSKSTCACNHYPRCKTATSSSGACRNCCQSNCTAKCRKMGYVGGSINSNGNCYCRRASAGFVSNNPISAAVQVQAYRYSNDYNIPYAYMTKTPNAVMDSPISGFGA